MPAAAKTPLIDYALWDVGQKKIDVAAVQKADHIIHLAGAGVVDHRWSTAYKKEIQQSRTQSSELIVDTLKQYPNKVQSIISASATGWYGPDVADALPFTEEAPACKDFLGETCRLWEASIDNATALNKRVVKLRTGIVLSNEGGAFGAFKKPLGAGIAAILGNGKQVVSWIHMDDLCRMYIAALENEVMKGAYNAVAPAPVNNKTLTLEIAKMTRGRFYIPVHVPPFVLKLVLGESSIEVLKSCTVSCEKIKQAGFTFIYPSIEAAVKELCDK